MAGREPEERRNHHPAGPRAASPGSGAPIRAATCCQHRSCRPSRCKPYAGRRSRLDEAFEREEPKQPSVRWSGHTSDEAGSQWLALRESFYRVRVCATLFRDAKFELLVCLPGSRKRILPAQLDVTLGRFDIGRIRAATRRPMLPLRSTTSSRRLIDMTGIRSK